MKSNEPTDRGVKMQRWTAFTFWRWTSLFLASYGVGHAILVVLVGLVFGLRIRSLLLPYLLLLWCGYIGAVSIYWARLSYERPKSGAKRFALALFFYLNLYMGVLVFSAFNLHLLSREAAIYEYGPYILPGAALGSIVVYIMARRSLEAISQHDNMISDEELKRIAVRCEAATPGPWKSWVEGRDHESGDHFISTGGEDIYLTGATLADQDFIAAARQDIPTLINAIRELKNRGIG